MNWRRVFFPRVDIAPWPKKWSPVNSLRECLGGGRLRLPHVTTNNSLAL